MKISLKLINKMNQLNRKWIQDRIRPFTENETEVSLKHMKKMLNLKENCILKLYWDVVSLRMTYSETVAGRFQQAGRAWRSNEKEGGGCWSGSALPSKHFNPAIPLLGINCSNIVTSMHTVECGHSKEWGSSVGSRWQSRRMVTHLLLWEHQNPK